MSEQPERHHVGKIVRIGYAGLSEDGPWAAEGRRLFIEGELLSVDKEIHDSDEAGPWACVRDHPFSTFSVPIDRCRSVEVLE